MKYYSVPKLISSYEKMLRPLNAHCDSLEIAKTVGLCHKSGNKWVEYRPTWVLIFPPCSLILYYIDLDLLQLLLSPLYPCQALSVFT